MHALAATAQQKTPDITRINTEHHRKDLGRDNGGWTTDPYSRPSARLSLSRELNLSWLNTDRTQTRELHNHFDENQQRPFIGECLKDTLVVVGENRPFPSADE